MKRSLKSVFATLFSTENISTIFYLVALIPLILMSYFYITYPFGLMIPVYGFVILVLKKPKLFAYQKAGKIQKLLGLAMIFTSFFAYFFVSPFIPNAAFYGFGNYILYLIGLFFVFFEIRALREAFSPLFLILAFVTSSFVADFAELLFSPFLSQFTSFLVSTLKAVGLSATYSSSNSNIITLYTMRGPIRLSIVWACVGFASMYIFSIILVVVMSEDPSDTKTKVIWASIGVLGTFFINIFRLIVVFVGYSYGYEYGELVHPYAGYVLFIAWSAIFLCTFSKRNVISQKIKMISAKLLTGLRKT